MNEQLRKRLEEAAEKITHCEFCRYKDDNMSCKELCADTIMTIRGIELGYKEAIKVAIKWWNYNLLSNYHNAEAYVEKRITKEELFEFFEKEMLNLLEEKQ